YSSAVAVPPLQALGRDATGAFRLHANLPTNQPCSIQASSDLVHWTPVFSSVLGGPLDFLDSSARNYAKRFYRLAAQKTETPVYLSDAGLLRLSAPGRVTGGKIGFHVETPPSFPCIVEASTNLRDWRPVFTNWSGGVLDFIDPDATNYSSRFYRLAST